ncbi:hypothetical protein D9M68_883420 [compost metagenome]
MATVNRILTPSHKTKLMNIEITCPADRRDNALDVIPQAIRAVGITTEAAPYNTEEATGTERENNHPRAPANSPTSTCTPTTRQADNAGWLRRHCNASSCVRGLNSGSTAPSSQASEVREVDPTGGIVDMANY